MPNKETIARLNALGGPCPCDGCFMWKRCKEGRACLAFARYIWGNPQHRVGKRAGWADTDRRPTKRFFRSIFAATN